MKTEIVTVPTVSSPATRAPAHPPIWQVAAAFAAIYVVWGSTYLAIRFAVGTIPPFLMAGTRFLTAGSLLYAFVRLRGAARPTRGEWRDAAIAGTLLLAGGNGGVTWAEQVIPSGVTALLVALMPMWMVLLDWLRSGGVRPRSFVIIGLAVGFAGVGLLAHDRPEQPVAGYGWGVAALMGATIAWAIGSMLYRHSRKPSSPLLGVAMQMLAGGAVLVLAAAVRGEPARFSFTQVTLASFSGWLYLTTFGSLVGFSAYVWLLRVSTPARVSTYAYVNPLIAVFLGCTVGGERLSNQLFFAGGLIVLAVVMIVRSSGRVTAAPARSRP